MNKLYFKATELFRWPFFFVPTNERVSSVWYDFNTRRTGQAEFPFVLFCFQKEGFPLEFLTAKVLFISLFIMIIHSIDTLAYSVRLSGAKVKLIASALSLFSMLVIVSRMSNMMQQPFTGSLIDSAPLENTLNFVENQYRVLIAAATVGTVVGMLLMPTFVAIFSRAITHLVEKKGNMLSILSLKNINGSAKYIKLPSLSSLRDVDFSQVPKRLFLFNVIVTAIYTIGVLSALYASLLAPDRYGSTIMASGLINGIATILLSLFIDPKISVVADGVVNGKEDYRNLKGITVMMVSSRLIGTVIAQLLFIPGAMYIAWVTQFLV